MSSGPCSADLAQHASALEGLGSGWALGLSAWGFQRQIVGRARGLAWQAARAGGGTASWEVLSPGAAC